MDEKTLKAKLVKELRARVPWVVLRVETGETTAGVPDIVVVGNHFTSWWEVKYANPSFHSKGIQELTCNRLAHHGFCRYLIYWDDGINSKRTLIVHPSDFGVWQNVSLSPWTDGFNHDWVITNIIDRHREK